MSACRTCETLKQTMPSRVVIVLRGVHLVTNLDPAAPTEGLEKAKRLIERLIEQERASPPVGARPALVVIDDIDGGPSHG